MYCHYCHRRLDIVHMRVYAARYNADAGDRETCPQNVEGLLHTLRDCTLGLQDLL